MFRFMLMSTCALWLIKPKDEGHFQNVKVYSIIAYSRPLFYEHPHPKAFQTMDFNPIKGAKN
jgi:hypothetical protein